MADGPDERYFAQTLADQLTVPFYTWERCGRGWEVFPYPVVVEPPFRPFAFEAPAVVPGLDDARRPTAASRFVDRLLGRAPSLEPQLPERTNDPEPEAETDEDDAEIVAIQVALPPDVKISPDVAEHFLLSLSACRSAVSLEIIRTANGITVQFACREHDAPHVREQLRAFLPDVTLAEDADILCDAWQPSASPALVVEFGLSDESMRPLRTFSRFDADPHMGVMGAHTDLQLGETALLQVLFTVARAPWAPSMLRCVMDGEGESFFENAPDMLPLTKEKVGRPLYAAVVRVAAQSRLTDRTWHFAKRLSGALTQLASPPSNALIPLENDDYEDADHATDVVLRRTRRSGMPLNSEEFTALVHLPSATVRTPKLKRDHRRTKAAPAITRGHALRLGDNVHGGVTQPVTVSREHRLRHMHVVGASGTGKSTLLLNLILQDLEQGEGVAVLDPHGDLIDQILGYILERRHEDLILIDPADAEFPVGFNILSAHSELEKT